jgi:hypothetical protein
MPTPRSIPSHMYQMWGSGGLYEPFRGIEKGRSPDKDPGPVVQLSLYLSWYASLGYLRQESACL